MYELIFLTEIDWLAKWGPWGGAGISLIGFIYLLIKDCVNSRRIKKNKSNVKALEEQTTEIEAQNKELKNQTKALEDQADALSKHTQELQKHSDHYKQQNQILEQRNDLLEKSLDTQNEVLNRLIELQTQNQEANQQRAAIEAQRLILENQEREREKEMARIRAQPNFKVIGTSTRAMRNEFSIELENNGEPTQITKLEVVNINEVRIRAMIPCDVETNDVYRLTLEGWGETSLGRGFILKIYYTDSLGNDYTQNFTLSSNGRYTLDTIVPVEED